jgi:hypothetical protein
VLALTAHAERVGVLAVLGVLVLVGWCTVALGVSAASEASGARTVGAVVSKRNGSTTIVVGGPFAAAAIVVPNGPEPGVDVAADDSCDRVVAKDLPVIFGSIAIFESSAVPEPEPAVVVEADRILAASAALEELWRLPAATADQRQPVTKQA